MKLLYQNKYRINSTRLPDWDYSQNGYYFVTICTKEHMEHFGKVINEIVELNGIGNIAQSYWLAIPDHFPHAILDDFVIMPNHIHGIVIIENVITENRRDAINRVSTTNTPHGGSTGNQNHMLKHSSLSSIIRWYKGRCTYQIHKQFSNRQFAWQPRFYDRIIRDESEMHKIKQYVRYNPVKWEHTRTHPANFDI